MKKRQSSVNGRQHLDSGASWNVRVRVNHPILTLKSKYPGLEKQVCPAKSACGGSLLYTRDSVLSDDGRGRILVYIVHSGQLLDLLHFVALVDAVTVYPEISQP